MSENYSEVLEVAQQKLSEGDYLQIANLLKQMHTATERKEQIYTEDIKEINTFLKWKTMKGKELSLDVYKNIIHRYPGALPNKYFVEFCWNSGVRQKAEEDDFVNEFTKVISAFGMKDLQINVYGVSETFKNLGEYRRTLAEIRNAEIKKGDDDEIEEYDFEWDTEKLVKELCSL